MQIPETFCEKDACEAWRSQVLEWGHGRNVFYENIKADDFKWAIDKAKEFLIAWDAQCGIEVEKGDFE